MCIERLHHKNQFKFNRSAKPFFANHLQIYSPNSPAPAYPIDWTDVRSSRDRNGLFQYVDYRSGTPIGPQPIENSIEIEFIPDSNPALFEVSHSSIHPTIDKLLTFLFSYLSDSSRLSTLALELFQLPFNTFTKTPQFCPSV